MHYLAVPVFHPTWEEFQDFSSYVAKVEAQLGNIGVFKVVPPAEWKPNHGIKSLEALDIEIATPIKQYTDGARGLYQQMHEECSSMTLQQFIKNSKNGSNHDLPPLKEYKKPISEGDLEAVERKYWKQIQFLPAIYGADVPASLFDDTICKVWNLNNLDSLLGRKIEKSAYQLPGITSPYLYIGMYKSTFCWHTEDMELYSISYHHGGSPKTWYSIPLNMKQKFETFCAQQFPALYKQCPQFLRHKCTLVSPQILRDHGIPTTRVTQEQNEFIVTLPGAYHAGFNHGFNIAEAVNFATERWIDIGKSAKLCKCSSDNVKIDIDFFFGTKKVEPIQSVDTSSTLVSMPSTSSDPTAATDTAGPIIMARRMMAPAQAITDTTDNITQQYPLLKMSKDKLVVKMKLNSPSIDTAVNISEPAPCEESAEEEWKAEAKKQKKKTSKSPKQSKQETEYKPESKPVTSKIAKPVKSKRHPLFQKFYDQMKTRRVV